ncbi:MAG: hypothetical protein GY795_39260 [Desulfobacterales bacterium]|nr:hypothetical protein [Desulfobacterales bacterium]
MKHINLFILVLFIVILSCSTNFTHAADKSASKQGLIQLPSAGGTIQKETGSFQIQSNTGAATYSLPLPSLPSRAGFSPSLSLNYSQFNGSSGFGMGWSLSVSSVELNHDLGIPIAGHLNSGEFRNPLSLDGKKLVFDKTKQGKLFYIFETSSQDTRVIFHQQKYIPSNAKTVMGKQPEIREGFEVIYPNGLRRLYSGGLAVAEGVKGKITRYPLKYEINPAGEVISYNYLKYEGRSYLTDIFFAGGKSHYHFDLIDTKPSVIQYQNGFRQTNGKLYSRMTASFDGDIHVQWGFAYIGRSLDNNTEFTVRSAEECIEQARKDLIPKISRDSLNILDELRVVYRFGNDKTLKSDSLQNPKLFFDYSSWTGKGLKGKQLVYKVPSLVKESSFTPHNYELADIDKDGLTDVVRQDIDQRTRVHFGTGDIKNIFKQGKEWWILNRGEKQISPDLRSDRFHFADLNGDGYTDVVEFDFSKTHVFLGGHGGEFKWTGKPVDLPKSIGADSFHNGASQFVDINSDGFSDILTSVPDEEGVTQWRVYFNISKRTSENWKFRYISKKLKMPWNAAISKPLTKRYFRVVDINGDKLPDFVRLVQAKSGICIYQNKGAYYKPVSSPYLFGRKEKLDSECQGGGRFVKLPGLPEQKSLNSIWFIDVNGDAILDFVSLGRRSDELLVWLGFGDLSVLEEPLRLSLPDPVNMSSDSTSRTRVADIDGDGQSEIIIFQANPVNRLGHEDKDAHAIIIDFNRTETKQLIKANLLTTIQLDSGLQYDFQYATSTDAFLRDKRRNHSVSPIHFPVIVVKQIVSQKPVSNTDKSLQVTELFYHNPFYNRINKKFLGFSSVEQVIYGDEYRGQESTQNSVYMSEKYYTNEEEGRLSGRLKEKKIYSLPNSAQVKKRTDETNHLNTDAEALHSLSTYTQFQQLPEKNRLIKEDQHEWILFQRKNKKSWFLRKQGDTSVTYSDTGTGDTETKAVTTVIFKNYDEFNLPHQVEKTIQEINGPYQVIIPASTVVTTYNYENSRKTLSKLNITDKPSQVITASKEDILGTIDFTYYPRNGLVHTQTAGWNSRLDKVPEELQPYFSKDKTYKREYEYDVYGNPLKVKDYLGILEDVDYDQDGIFPAKHVRPYKNDSGRDLITVLKYDGQRKGFLSSYRTPLGLWHRVQYDSLGRRTRISSDNGAEQVYKYKQAKFVRDEQRWEPVFILTGFKRYPDNQVPADEVQWIWHLKAYQSDGTLVAHMEDADEGGIRVLQYSAYNRNKSRVFEWTPYIIATGQVNNVSDVFKIGYIPQKPSDQVGQRYRYDALGRLKTHQYPSGKLTRYAYHPWGVMRESEYTDQFSGVVKYQRFEIGNELGIYAVIEKDGKTEDVKNIHISRFGRDSGGNLSEIMLPGESEPRTLVYNTRNELEYQKIPGMGEIYYQYDERGRPVVQLKIGEKNEQHIIRRYYDELDRPLKVVADNKPAIAYEYDFYPEEWRSHPVYSQPIEKPLGLMTRVMSYDTNQVYDYAEQLGYDLKGQVVHRQISMADSFFGESYQYSLDGTQRKMSNPFELEASYTLGKAMRLKAVRMKGKGFDKPEEIISNVTYNPKGQLARMDYRKGAYTLLSYNPDTLFPEKIQTAVQDGNKSFFLQDLHLFLNQNGSVSQIKDKIGPTDYGHVNRTARFEYNWKDELVLAERYGQNLHYDYMPCGSFSVNEELDSEPLAFDNMRKTNLIPVGTKSKKYQFDGLGQLSATPRIIKTKFNAFGQLVYAETRDTEHFYGYNAGGIRIYKKRVKKNADTSEPFSISLFPTPNTAIEPSGRQSFVFVAGSRVARIEHVSEKDNTVKRWFFYLKDHLDSSDILMTSDGKPVEQMLYLAYGTELSPEIKSEQWRGYVKQNQAQLPAEKTHNRYTGHYLDDETGLYYFGARYYSCELGRFISPDSTYIEHPENCVKNPHEANLYIYALNNPIKFVDQNGNWAALAARIGRAVYCYAASLISSPDLQQDIHRLSESFARRDIVDIVGDAASIFIPRFSGGRYATRSFARNAKRMGEKLGIGKFFRSTSKSLAIRIGSFKQLGKAYPKEISFAKELSSKGYDVVLRGKGAQGADLVVSGTMYELKTLKSASINAVRQNIRSALKQADRVFIDGRASGLSHGTAIRAIKQHAAAGRMKNASEIRILTSSGEYVWTP